MVLRTATHLYLFELKLGKDSQAAMKQIDFEGVSKALRPLRIANRKSRNQL